MPDIALDGESIRMVSGEGATLVQLGEAAPPGTWAYLKTTDNRYWIADCTDLTKSVVAGFLVAGGSAGDWVFLVSTSGQLIDPGAVLVAGEIYVLSEAGAMSPEGDLTTGDHVSILGVGNDDGNLIVGIQSSGVQL